MYETAQKYSEQRYLTKAKLAQEIDSYLLEPIWQEVKNYRSLFRYDLQIHQKPYYLTRNPLTINKILQVEELMRRYEDTQTERFDYYCPYLDEEENQHYQQYLIYLQLHPYLSKEEFFLQILQRFHIDDINKLHLQFLLSEEEPFLLRYFTLMFISRRSSSLLMMPFLIIEHRTYIKELCSIVTFKDSYEEEIDDDITYAFLTMLEELRLLLYKKMVSLNHTPQDLCKVLQEEELIERYPNLKKEQIHFYVQHRKLGHYYTIQNYIQQMNVCYETARYSLDQLVEHHWYEKKKVGKKFVYFIV